MPSLSSVRSESQDTTESQENFEVSSEGIKISMQDIMYVAIVLAVVGYLYYKCSASSSED
jgi:hypothetical protein